MLWWFEISSSESYPTGEHGNLAQLRTRRRADAKWRHNEPLPFSSRRVRPKLIRHVERKERASEASRSGGMFSRHGRDFQMAFDASTREYYVLLPADGRIERGRFTYARDFLIIADEPDPSPLSVSVLVILPPQSYVQWHCRNCWQWPINKSKVGTGVARSVPIKFGVQCACCSAARVLIVEIASFSTDSFPPRTDSRAVDGLIATVIVFETGGGRRANFPKGAHDNCAISGLNLSNNVRL
ncbi:unnamed protein product, partial [Iphiclides podalirius]